MSASSGAGERARVFLDENDPYFPMLEQLAGFRTAPVTVEELAKVVADALEASEVPFRIPVGEAAIAQLEARKAAPEDEPFVAAPLNW
jgi:hypothetical protein